MRFLRIYGKIAVTKNLINPEKYCYTMLGTYFRFKRIILEYRKDAVNYKKIIRSLLDKKELSEEEKEFLKSRKV